MDRTAYSVSALADLLLITDRRVQQLAAEGVLPKAERGAYPLAASVQAYVRYLRSQIADEGDHKQRLIKARADVAEIEAGRLSGELLPCAEVRLVVTASFARVRAKLLALPTKLAPLVISEPTVAATREKLENGIHEALTELADTIVAGIPADQLGEPDGAGAGAGSMVGVPAAAETDGQSVGGPGKAPVARGKRRTGKVGHKPG